MLQHLVFFTDSLLYFHAEKILSTSIPDSLDLILAKDLESALDLWHQSSEQQLLYLIDEEKKLLLLNEKGINAPIIGILDPESPNHWFSGLSYLITDLEALDSRYLNLVYCRYYNLPLSICETKRTLVREFTILDYPAIVQLYQIFPIEVLERTTDSSLLPFETEELLNTYIHSIYSIYGFGLFGVFDRESELLIGICGFTPSNINGRNQIELGYLIHPAFQNKGYAFEVCSELISLAISTFELDELILKTSPKNAASVQLAGKLGFHFDQTASTTSCHVYNFLI